MLATSVEANLGESLSPVARVVFRESFPPPLSSPREEIIYTSHRPSSASSPILLIPSCKREKKHFLLLFLLLLRRSESYWAPVTLHYSRPPPLLRRMSDGGLRKKEVRVFHFPQKAMGIKKKAQGGNNNFAPLHALHSDGRGASVARRILLRQSQWQGGRRVHGTSYNTPRPPSWQRKRSPF